MRAEFFCDSNILLYAASNAPEDAVKRAAARRVLALPGVGFSAQVLQEFYVNATRKQALRPLLIQSRDRRLVLGRGPYRIAYATSPRANCYVALGLLLKHPHSGK